MSDTQKRIRVLDPYTQLDPGDGGYIAKTAIRIPVDTAGFGGDPKYITLASISPDTHFEKGRDTGLGSRSVTITFDTAFNATPTGIDNLRVYRITEIVSGKWKIEDVMYYHDSATPVNTTECTLEIETDEPLSGIIVEWLFLEV